VLKAIPIPTVPNTQKIAPRTLESTRASKPETNKTLVGSTLRVGVPIMTRDSVEKGVKVDDEVD
jgi:hypothetical protein